MQEPTSTVRIDTRRMMSASINGVLKRLQEGDQEVLEQIARLNEVMQRFEQAVWFGGLQEAVRTAKTSGLSLEVDGFEFFCFTTAGRAMITLEDKEAFVTVVTVEDGSDCRMGLHGIGATGPQATGLFERAMKLWADGKRLGEDSAVRIAGT